LAKWLAVVLAAGLTVLAIGTLVGRLWPKSDIPVPAIVSARVVGGLCPEGPERVGYVEVSVRVPGGADDDQSLHLGVEGGQRTFYDGVGEESHRALGFTEAALVESAIEVTATITRLDPGDHPENTRTVTKQVPCEEVEFRLPAARVPDRAVRICRKMVALRPDRICELTILRSEGKVKPGPYTERELTAAIGRGR
jgi:hypothetical protein